MRLSIIVVGCIATLMALTVRSIYGLWYLSSDLVYVILFPQLVCVVYYKKYCNTYGSLVAYFIGLFLRAAGGEEIMGLSPFIHYPFYDQENGQLFPFRTFSMLVSFFTLIAVSILSKRVFESGWLPPYFDIFHCVINIPDDIIIVQEPHEEEELSVLNLSVAKKYQASEANGRVNPALDSEEEEANKKEKGKQKEQEQEQENEKEQQDRKADGNAQKERKVKNVTFKHDIVSKLAKGQNLISNRVEACEISKL